MPWRKNLRRHAGNEKGTFCFLPASRYRRMSPFPLSYLLTSQDLSRLSSSGVSDKVIMEMQNRRPDAVTNRPARLPRHVFVGPPPGPVYIMHPLPPPPPPPGFHVGLTSLHYTYVLYVGLEVKKK